MSIESSLSIAELHFTKETHTKEDCKAYLMEHLELYFADLVRGRTLVFLNRKMGNKCLKAGTSLKEIILELVKENKIHLQHCRNNMLLFPRESYFAFLPPLTAKGESSRMLTIQNINESSVPQQLVRRKRTSSVSFT